MDKQLPGADAPLMIRTYFDDPAAWAALRRAVETPPLVEGEPLEADVQYVDDRAYEHVTPERLVALAPAGGAYYCFVADRLAMTSDEHPVIAVDLDDDEERRGQTFRIVAGELVSFDANLSIGNMDFWEWADAADADGIFRGF
ncbi:DUF6924 domain-containing protein [Streptomyces sp. NPDC101227]|uniref:DUF6924 domain-containing protein n=1 Tax=Streptomyces sp. NPDC101227 TaxID=3366136 RepID=UPI0037F1B4FA